jgi:hypothetical protein
VIVDDVDIAPNAVETVAAIAIVDVVFSCSNSLYSIEDSFESMQVNVPSSFPTCGSTSLAHVSNY